MESLDLICRKCSMAKAPVKCATLSLLPLELVEQVLAFLPVRDAVRCTCVCQQWRLAVLRCPAYWKRVCAKLGVRPEPSLSWRDSGMAGLSLNRQFKELMALGVVRMNTIPHCVGNAKFKKNHHVHKVVAADPGSVGVVAVHGHRRRGDKHLSSFLSLQSFKSEEGGVEETRMDVSCSFELQWCTASPSYITVYGSNGECYLHTRRTTTGGPSTQQWKAGKLHLDAQVFGSCSSCPLMVLTYRHLPLFVSNTCRVKLLKLPAPPLDYVRTSYFRFKIDKDLPKGLEVVGVRLLQSGCEVDGQYCMSHKLLIDACGTVFVLEVTQHSEQASPSVQQLATLHKDPGPQYSGVRIGYTEYRRLVVSSDCKLAGLTHGRYLYCWELDSLTLVSRARLSFVMTQGSRLLALGLQFSVLCTSTSIVMVVCTATGKILHRCSFGRYPFEPPLRQDWLNSLDTDTHRMEIGVCRKGNGFERIFVELPGSSAQV